MPHTVQMATKKIIVKSGIQVILQSYEQAIGSLSPEQKQVLGVSSDEHSRDGILAMVQSKAESVSGTRNGAKERCLNAIECNLSEFAFELREAYIGFLNALIQQVKKTAQDAEAEEIESRYVLVRELLLRLLTVGLSDEENNKRAGDGFIAAMKTFVESILGKENLELHDKFRYTLCYQHPEWLQRIGQAIDIIKLIHLPQSTFTALVNYLDQIKRATKIHILFGSGVSVSASDISERWINTSYQTFLLGQKPQSEAIIPASNHEDKLSLALIPLQEKKLESIKHRLIAPHLRELFLLLNQTELLSKMVAKIDNLIKASAWVLLLTGKLRFEPLIHYLKTHQQRCEDLLDVGKLGLKQNSSACRTLITCNLLSAKGITAVVPDICRKIQQLGSLGNHTLMMKQFGCDLNELLAYEELLGIKLLGDGSMPLTLTHVPETAVQQIDYSTKTNNALVTGEQIPHTNTFWQNNYRLIEEYQGHNTENISPISVALSNTNNSSTVVEEESNHSLLTGENTMREATETTTLLEQPNNNTTPSQRYFVQNIELDETQIIALVEHKRNTPDYIKTFFNRFSDKKYEAIVSMMWKQAKFAEQIKMGGKGKPTDMQEMGAISENDFLYQFNQGQHLPTAGPLCKEVTKIIKEFESQQMDYEQPSNFFLILLSRDKLWEKRHYELFYLKYWCVANSGEGVDETKLIKFIRTMSSQSETLPLSDYNSLVDKLKELITKIDQGELIPLEYAFAQGETQRFKQLYKEEIERNRETTASFEARIREQENKLDQRISEVRSLQLQLNAKNAQLETESQIHKREMEEMKERMQRFEAFMQQNSTLMQTEAPRSTPRTTTTSFFNN